MRDFCYVPKQRKAFVSRILTNLEDYFYGMIEECKGKKMEVGKYLIF
jgi:hypothetical protein